jgi:hypothetical protein
MVRSGGQKALQIPGRWTFHGDDQPTPNCGPQIAVGRRKREKILNKSRQTGEPMLALAEKPHEIGKTSIPLAPYSKWPVRHTFADWFILPAGR